MSNNSERRQENLDFIYEHSVNLDYLESTPEFEDIRLKLREGTLDDEYIAKIRKHLGNIDPHYKKVIVDGQEENVFFTTKVD